MQLRIWMAGLIFGVAALAAETGAELFQKAVTAERAAGDLEQAIKLYQQAEQKIAADMPNIPLWSENGLGAHSTKLVQANQAFGRTPDMPAADFSPIARM